MLKFSVVYVAKTSGNHEIAGYTETERQAERLAKVFLEGGRLTDRVLIYEGKPGEMLIHELKN